MVHLNTYLTLRFVVLNLLTAHTAVMLSSDELIASTRMSSVVNVTPAEKVLRGARARHSAVMVSPWRAEEPLVRQGGSLSI